MATTTASELRELLSPREIAALTGLHISTIYRSIRAGVYPTVRVGRNAVRIPRDSFITSLITKEKK